MKRRRWALPPVFSLAPPGTSGERGVPLVRQLLRSKFPVGLVGALLAVLLAGCAGGGRGGGGAVAEVHLFGVPVALNLDGVPGPDGIGVRIYASGSGVARGIVVRSGVLEVLMFDGAVPASRPRSSSVGTRRSRPARVRSIDT